MTPPALQHAPLFAAAALAAAGAGVLLAWWLRRYTMVSIRNLYLAAIVAITLDAWAVYDRAATALVVLVPVTSFTVSASAAGRRWRLSDLVRGRSCAHTNARGAGCGSDRRCGPRVSACTSSPKARSSANVNGPSASPTSR